MPGTRSITYSSTPRGESASGTWKRVRGTLGHTVPSRLSTVYSRFMSCPDLICFAPRGGRRSTSSRSPTERR